MRLSEAAKLQQEIAEQVVERDDFDEIRNVCAVDVAYDDRNAYCSAVVTSRSGNLLESADSTSTIKHPYVPGFMMLREAPPVFRTLRKLKRRYDLLLVDGHGRLHPRKCGIACYLGVRLDRPTIGIAKGLLCGNILSDGLIELDGKTLGQTIGSGRRRLYVSVGHRLSLATAVSLVKELGNGAMPEAMKQADARSKMQKREKGTIKP